MPQIKKAIDNSMAFLWNNSNYLIPFCAKYLMIC